MMKIAMVRCLLLTIMTFSVLACQSMPQPTTSGGQARSTARHQDAGRPVAFAAGIGITQADLSERLYEAQGGIVLEEVILQRLLEQQLQQMNRTISQADLEHERQLLRETLSSDPNEAARLLQELRRARGLGQQRFNDLLWRNAALRKLVVDDVDITPAALQRQFDIVYGEKRLCRIIVVETAGEAARIHQQVLGGASFAQMAEEFSVDRSGDAGGLMPPISMADGQYPVALRQALAELTPGQVSGVIAMDNLFGIIRLERIEAARHPNFAQVEDGLRRDVRLQIERLLMERLARTMLEQSRINVLNPALNESWNNRQRRD